uniref:Uncharacterized protein n=1 Tax=Oryza punctata TaxID=4537 RepID=A0A0E0KBP2_ORYPU
MTAASFDGVGSRASVGDNDSGARASSAVDLAWTARAYPTVADLARHGASRPGGEDSKTATRCSCRLWSSRWAREREPRLSSDGEEERHRCWSRLTPNLGLHRFRLMLPSFDSLVAPDAAIARFVGRAHRRHRIGRVVVMERDGKKRRGWRKKMNMICGSHVQVRKKIENVTIMIQF